MPTQVTSREEATTMIVFSKGQHVVIGFGNVGRSLAEQLVAEGAEVTVLTRKAVSNPASGAKHVVGNLSNLRDLWRKIPQASVVYNCANPPYQHWSREWPHLTRAVNAFAQSAGAVLATASNLYGYGPAQSPLTEALPLRATFRNGRARLLSWQETIELHRKGLLRVTEVRAADYICPGQQSRVGDRVVPRVLSGKSVQLLGKVDTPHSWSFPSDVARALITVANDERGWGRAWHVPSNPPRSQKQVIDDIADVAGVKHVKVSTLPKSIERFVAMGDPVIRELRDTDYQFAKPFTVDSSAITSTFGISATPWDDGLRALVSTYEQPKSSRVAQR
jgi:nucleoside-diphosphate-sugar epimerase